MNDCKKARDSLLNQLYCIQMHKLYTSITILIWLLSCNAISAQLSHSCEKPLLVCAMDTLYLNSQMINAEIDEIDISICGAKNLSSAKIYKVPHWLKYNFDSDGDFKFTLYPTSMKTDLDFFVFYSTGDCNSLTNIRCMLSGSDDNPRCMGTTGLRESSMDTYEYTGCDYYDDNYLAPISVKAGDILYVVIYNISNDGSEYRVIHDGTASLACNTSIKSHVTAEIYPNPSSGKLKISSYNLLSKKVGIEIYDSAGKNQMRQTVEIDQIIDISHLPSGVLFINIHEDGQLIKSQKFLNIK